VDLIALAGYLRFIPVDVTRRWRGRIVNVHPSLLPSFGGAGMYGIRVHQAVIAAGVRVTGVTVHFVDEEYDRGPIIAQWPVPVLPHDDAETLARRVLAVEHRLYPAALDALASGTITLGGDARVIGWSPDFSFICSPQPV
jgi:folate-dependent phosphoribosylglycinamide formyltransferase PurN